MRSPDEEKLRIGEEVMASIVRAALLQAAWTGDRESMVEKGAHYAI